MERKLNITPIQDWGIFDCTSDLLLIAGPCSAETLEQVVDTAIALKNNGIKVFRAGIWKPRTLPGSFEGVGEIGLQWLKTVQQTLGMKVCTEVANAQHVKACIDAGVDMLWIGARTTANPFLMQEIADALQGSNIPVLVKNPISPELGLWIGAMERLNRAGITKIGAIHRGFATIEKTEYRNTPMWQVAIELRTKYPYLPIFADPSHIGGDRKYIREISQRALDLGIDGLMVECHYKPSCALSDAPQQLTPTDLSSMLNSLCIRKKTCSVADYKESIGELRTQIDVIDENIIQILHNRMNISKKIGLYKKNHNLTILQTDRWDSLLTDVVNKGDAYGLDKNFIINVFSAIHEASVAVQDEILSKH